MLETPHLADLEVLLKEYPFFETAHLLYTKGLHIHNSINYSKQLRKTAIVANNRSVLYELLQQPSEKVIAKESKVEIPKDQPTIKESVQEVQHTVSPIEKISPVTSTNTDLKVIYINTVPSQPLEVVKEKEVAQSEIDIVKGIENKTDENISAFNEEKLNQTIEAEITRGVVQSYVATDIIKTPDLYKEEQTEPTSFTEWLNKIKKESATLTTNTGKEDTKTLTSSSPNKGDVEQGKSKNDVKTDKKPTFFEQNKQIIDKIIETDPSRIKLSSNKFFTPNTDAKQSLLENEHLVTETLAKIYALQGNISKAIRAYEILSLKFPQKSVYFASLIEKLKTNK